MRTKNETEALNDLIIIQEMRYSDDLAQLKNQFNITYESVKPINLIKNLIHDVTSSPEIKNDLFTNIIGFGTGFLSKKLLLGSTHNPIKKVFGTLFEFAVANTVSKHSEGIKTIGNNLFKRYFNKN